MIVLSATQITIVWHGTLIVNDPTTFDKVIELRNNLPLCPKDRELRETGVTRVR